MGIQRIGLVAPVLCAGLLFGCGDDGGSSDDGTNETGSATEATTMTGTMATSATAGTMTSGPTTTMTTDATMTMTTTAGDTGSTSDTATAGDTGTGGPGDEAFTYEGMFMAADTPAMFGSSCTDETLLVSFPIEDRLLLNCNSGGSVDLVFLDFANLGGSFSFDETNAVPGSEAFRIRVNVGLFNQGTDDAVVGEAGLMGTWDADTRELSGTFNVTWIDGDDVLFFNGDVSGSFNIVVPMQ